MFQSMQDAYDKVVDHLEQQGRRGGKISHRAGTQYFECLYLAPDGAKCAIGALLPEGHPLLLDQNQAFEDYWNGTEYDPLFGIEGISDSVTRYFWQALQEAHDDSKSKNDLNIALAFIAEEHDLIPRTVTHWEET
tara:strand:- start:3754 stop:4158 length:405 start_codon:yes stop_codon:yes gene_type:complete